MRYDPPRFQATGGRWFRHSPGFSRLLGGIRVYPDLRLNSRIPHPFQDHPVELHIAGPADGTPSVIVSTDPPLSQGGRTTANTQEGTDFGITVRPGLPACAPHTGRRRVRAQDRRCPQKVTFGAFRRLWRMLEPVRYTLLTRGPHVQSSPIGRGLSQERRWTVISPHFSHLGI